MPNPSLIHQEITQPAGQRELAAAGEVCGWHEPGLRSELSQIYCYLDADVIMSCWLLIGDLFGKSDAEAFYAGRLQRLSLSPSSVK